MLGKFSFSSEDRNFRAKRVLYRSEWQYKCNAAETRDRRLERGAGVLDQHLEVCLEPGACLWGGLLGCGNTAVEIVADRRGVRRAITLT